MKVERLTELDCRFHVIGKDDPSRRWEIIAPFRFLVNGELFEVPPRFYTDFASIPRILWSVIAPEDLGYGPPGAHDPGYFFGWGKPREFWDDVLLAFMELDRVVEWKRERAYQAVRMFAMATWDNYRRLGSPDDQLARLLARANTAQEAFA